MSDDRDNVVDMAGTRVDDDHLLSMYIDNGSMLSALLLTRVAQ